MASTVWCARARYTVKQSQSEIEALVEDCANEYSFIWLDRFDREPENEGSLVMLRIGQISSVEHYTPPRWR